MGIVTYYRYLTLVIITFIYLNINNPPKLYRKTNTTRSQHRNIIVHMGTVLIGYNSTYNLYQSLKSIFLTRSTSLKFHILCDSISRRNLETIFNKWKIPLVTAHYYDINQLSSSVHPKLLFLHIMDPLVINKLIVFEAGVIFKYNVVELHNVFENFQEDQVIGLLSPIPERVQTDLILYHTRLLTASSILSNMQFIKSNEDVFNILTKTHPTLIYNVPFDNMEHTYCDKVNTSFLSNIAKYDGTLLRNTSLVPTNATQNNVPHTECTDFEKSVAFSWRVLPFIKTFEPCPSANVTLVSQLSYSRIYMLQEISSRWKGPLSFTLYLSESEVSKTLDLIKKTTLLANRSNIAYHVIFKESLHYPINLCRNIAWMHSMTSYVFLADIDFIPMQDLDVVLERHISQQKNMTRKAFVIPVFQPKANILKYPKNKTEALALFNQGKMKQFSYRSYPRGHRPTNYTLWKNSDRPYKITWNPGYEPYVMVSSDTAKYNERFVGYGANKISHIGHLHSLGYEFIGLPNTFAVHRNHPRSKDSRSFISYSRYRRCLNKIAKAKG